MALSITKMEAVDDDPDGFGIPKFGNPVGGIPGIGSGDVCTVGKTLPPDGVCWVELLSVV